MAVKKATKEPRIEAVEVGTVDTIMPTEKENTIEASEIDVVEETKSDVVVEEPTVVEVEEPSKTDDVEVTVEEPTINTKKFNGNVKIRMRVDHKCCIAMERYDLKEGKVYTVPENVKNILNKAGLLSPL